MRTRLFVWLIVALLLGAAGVFAYRVFSTKPIAQRASAPVPTPTVPGAGDMVAQKAKPDDSTFAEMSRNFAHSEAERIAEKKAFEEKKIELGNALREAQAAVAARLLENQMLKDKLAEKEAKTPPAVEAEIKRLRDDLAHLQGIADSEASRAKALQQVQRRTFILEP